MSSSNREGKEECGIGCGGFNKTCEKMCIFPKENGKSQLSFKGEAIMIRTDFKRHYSAGGFEDSSEKAKNGYRRSMVMRLRCPALVTEATGAVTCRNGE